MFDSMMVIMTYLLIVLTPVLIPAIIHAVHVIRDWRPTIQPDRLAAPAAA
ncbi:Mycobacterium numidiamassiliense ORFan [Mycobacterium numidiamassiliense]|jgi:hypothetical protein|uniref:Mycobacterium numidiamassiliense ORFan n=1 Tax=Mycobacterium numidiamassiliense TaxID=1841861 RepID=A0A2U3P3I0_9MYCO|nr:hypothetical protein [Mycobacterium numidiamassiliense]SPM38300.1 Mycobacterium numidiamassiliense ORFan [Mycobacterium numidiamassiliense]